VIKRTIGFRVDREAQAEGTDEAEQAGTAYDLTPLTSLSQSAQGRTGRTLT